MRVADYQETMGQVVVVNDGDHYRSHVQSALARGLPELQPALTPHDGHFVICASGPSLPRFVDEIRAERQKGRPIVAIKGAHDFLMEQGIVPDIFLTIEPRERLDQVKHKNGHTVYLLASRVDPAMFDYLKGCRITLWHTWAPQADHPELKGRMRIGGGTTSGLRAINVGYVLGFRKFILYGMDSCLAPDKETKRFSGEKAGHVVDRIVAGKTFYCNMALAMQADEFQALYQVMPDVTIDAKGDGLLAAILTERRIRGLRA